MTEMVPFLTLDTLSTIILDAAAALATPALADNDKRACSTADGFDEDMAGCDATSTLTPA